MFLNITPLHIQLLTCFLHAPTDEIEPTLNQIPGQEKLKNCGLIFALSLYRDINISHNAMYEPLLQAYNERYYNNLLKYSQLKEVFKLCEAKKYSLCILKGAAMVGYYYKNFAVRPEISDIDILVYQNEIKDLSHDLICLGFTVIPPRDLSTEQLLAYINGAAFDGSFLHAITFGKGPLIIDLHWRFNVFAIRGSFEENSVNMQAIKLFGYSVFVFKPELQFLHIIINGMGTYKVGKGTLWIADSLFILKKHPEFNWQALANCASEQYACEYVGGFLQWVKDHLELDYLKFWDSTQRKRMPFNLNLCMKTKRLNSVMLIKFSFAYEVYLRNRLINTSKQKRLNNYLKIYFGFESIELALRGLIRLIRK